MKSEKYLENFEYEIRNLFLKQKEDIYNWNCKSGKNKITLIQHMKNLINETKLIILNSQPDIYINYFINQIKELNFNFIDIDFSFYSYLYSDFELEFEESNHQFE